MTVGDKAYKGMGVPIHGESEIRQITAATDILTITRITAGTGDFLVLRDDGGSEVLSINKSGYINMGASLTTAPTTGLTKGELFLIWSANSVPTLACVTSSAANTIKYISPFDTKTLGRTT